MVLARVIAAGAIFLSATAAIAQSAAYTGPIIDVHQHSYPAGPLGPAPPLAALRPDIPAAYAGSAGAPDAAAQTVDTLAIMKRHNVRLAIQSYDSDDNDFAAEIANAKAIRTASGGHVLTGVSLRALSAGTPPEQIARAFQRGEIVTMGELAMQYIGKTAADPEYEPYLAMAEKNDIPVGIHTGSGPPRSSAHGSPNFRLRHGDPLLIEDILVRHPKLRVSLMHAGWPFLEETKGLLNQYPELYVDIGVIDWVMPKAEFYSYLKALVDGGYADRIMFGSDQMNWPATIGLAIETVNAAPFLSIAQKKAIFHDNAVRFYRLKE